MDKVYDMVIVGGGPGGYTAALYAARAGLDVLIVERLSAGGQMNLTGQIDNYPGFPEGVDGFELGENMQQQAQRFGAETLLANVTGIPTPVVTIIGCGNSGLGAAELAAAFGIQSIPTLVVIKGGKATAMAVGVQTPAQLDALMEQN